MLINVNTEGQLISKPGVLFNQNINKIFVKSSFFTKVMKNRLFELTWGEILRPESLRRI